MVRLLRLTAMPVVLSGAVRPTLRSATRMPMGIDETLSRDPVAA
ncbi:MAG: hypothetical protein JWR10_1010 [Rubritepida sp.]|nr:hypothetical protein [Rubritepida sp.]